MGLTCHQQYFEIRSRAIQKLRTSQDPNPYPHKFPDSYDPENFSNEFGHLKTGEHLQEKTLHVGARIMNIRSSGTKLYFLDVKRKSVSMQIMCQADNWTGQRTFEETLESLRRGDIIGVKGYPGRTAPKTRAEGELSLFAQEIILLTPCLHLLPNADAYHGAFTDQETRYRKRFLVGSCD